jgi:hypothetical protein
VIGRSLTVATVPSIRPPRATVDIDVATTASRRRQPSAWLPVISGAAALPLIGVVAWLLLQTLHPHLGPSIKTVSAQRLEQAGIVLANPFPWDRPAVSASDAERTALIGYSGQSSLQTVLAEVFFTGTNSKQPRLCWVISLPGSLVSSHGPPGSPHSQASFYLVFVDAQTGEFVQGTAGG